MDSSIEPGLLSTFRSLLKIQAVILIAALGLQLLGGGGTFLIFLVLYLFHTSILALILRARKLPALLGKGYLPLVLTAAALGPSLCHAGAILVRLGAGYSGPEAALDPGGLTLWLLPTLLMFSSQYTWKIVLLFTAASAGLDLTLTAILNLLGGPAFPPALDEITARVLIYLIISYVVTRFSSAQRQSRSALAEKNHQLADFAVTQEQLAVTRERNRMARELHDTLAHTLSALSVRLQAAEIMVRKDPEAAAELLEQLSTETREGTGEVRRAMHALRASPIEDLGLAGALTRQAESAARRAGCSLDLKLPDNLPDNNPVLSQHVYRMIDEALNNISRHARAGAITLALQDSGDELVIVIEDDGGGFDPGSVQEGCFGLTGIFERAALCGGSAQLRSASDEGTTWTIRVKKSL